MNENAIATKPVIHYSALVGRILQLHRDRASLKQGDLAAALEITQSAYSRLESGDSIVNAVQLRQATERMGVSLPAFMQVVEQYECRLRAQNVRILFAKKDNSAAVAIGLGLLAALALAR